MRIEAAGVEAVLGGAEILKGITLQAESGRCIGIIGPNGCGKSTLLKCIYRVLKPSAGAVYLGGKPLAGYSYRQSARQLGVVAQHNQYQFDFTVEEVVMMGRAPHKRTLERETAADGAVVAKALETVGMTPFAKREYATLSGGEQQRVILARALAQQTPCLILDEPTNHLDIKYQLELMDIVRQSGRTIIAAIHDLNIAGLYCDEIYALQKGRVVKYGTPREVLTPEVIYQLYEVEAEVLEGKNGSRHVLYQRAGIES